MKLVKIVPAVRVSAFALSLGLAGLVYSAPAAHASPLDNLATSYTGVLHSTKDVKAENIPVQFVITNHQFNHIAGQLTASGISLPVSGVMDDGGQMILTGSVVDKKHKTNLTVTGQARLSASGDFLTLVVSQVGKERGKKEQESLLMSLTADSRSAAKKKAPPSQVPPNLGNNYIGKYHSSAIETMDDVDVDFVHTTIPATGLFSAQFTLNGIPVSMDCQVFRAGVVLGQGHTIDPVTGQASVFTFNGLISAKGTYLVGFGLFNTIINGQAVQNGAGLSLQLSGAQ